MPTSASARPGLEALIHDVIAKPFTVAEIKSAVASAVAKGKRSP